MFDACLNCGRERNNQAAKHIEPEQEVSTASLPDFAPPDIHLVRRGRALLLLLIGTCVVDDLIGIFTWQWQMPPREVPWEFIIIYLACWYGLWYAVWRGYTWAIALMKILAVIIVVLGSIGAVLRSDITVIAPVVLFGVIWACLAKLKSIKEFFRHQRPPGPHGQPPGPPRMERFEKIATLDNEIEALCLRGKLEERGIPHLMQSNYDLAYDGLFQFSAGWGHVEAQVEHRDEILEILKAIRLRSAQQGGNSENCAYNPRTVTGKGKRV